MHEQDLEDLAVIAAMTIRLMARAQAADADSINDIASAAMAGLCLTIGVDGSAVRARAAQMLTDARSSRATAVH